ncbi:uncharacterized protein LOC112093376 [Morus notabilis]|uniref:uncharacterized protein LOC112093376 n=1 Tax=Morus notabilis TaxID=981085 RepID=UPI000CED307B|nr:uncharacterized protein LOC112093376 [Morus notabilis]
MTIVFDDMLHNMVECYVDDLVVKTKEIEHHLNDLKRVFDRLQQYQLKMNPVKCAFGVTSEKFLGFVVRHRGIEIDLAKIKAITEMPPPLKGQALADFLAAHPIPHNMELPDDLPDEEVFATEMSFWQLYFDGAVRKNNAGACIVFITLSGGLIPFSFSILATCTNNIAEYEALIIGLEITLEMQISHLRVFGDSQLIIKQINGEYAVKNENLTPYHEKTKHLMSQFQDIMLSHILRSENDKADALASLAASLVYQMKGECR